MDNTKLAVAQRYIDVAYTRWGTPLDARYQEDWQAWKQLAEECRKLYERRFHAVEIVSESEPYPTASAMFKALDRGDVFKVSGLNCEHPILTREQNIQFRAVHDIGGHWLAKANFSWKGEINAYLKQAELHSPLARRALYTEVIGQTAYRSVFGKFPEQRCFVYPQEIIDRVGELLNA